MKKHPFVHDSSEKIEEEIKKSNCSKHKVPEYLKDLGQVASDIADMPYDKVVEFFDHLALKLEFDAENDRKGGRVRLFILLRHAAFRVGEARESFEKIWDLCKPYMK
jgi:hypothetical protein